MKLNKKYLTLIPVLVFIACMLCACHDENDGHEHAKGESAKHNLQESEHEEAELTIATLSAEQINTVGISLGYVEQKQLTATVKLNGALRVPNNNKANATSLYGGVIKTIHVQAGSNVNKGKVIATISNPQFIQLQEEYLTIGSKLTFAEQESQRQQELNQGNAGALKNLQNADAELRSLRTRKASLKQQIQLMGINPATVSNTNLRSTLTVTSPISGTVSNIMGKIGSYVDVSTPVAEIVDNGQLHLDLNVFEKDLPLLKVGQTIHFRITNNASEEYDAKIYSVGTTFEDEIKSIIVHATVQGNRSGLIDGMNVTALVSLNNVTTATVPNDAIVSANGKDYVFIVTEKIPEENHEENTAQEKNAEAAKSEGSIHFEKIEVVKGISELGYTAITPVVDIPADRKIAIKGAFFINAKMTNQDGGHAH
jgi:RND family efflux transporter MFP subunit